MRNSLKGITKRLIAKLGYDIRKSPRPPLNRFQEASHPLQATYGQHEHGLVGLEAPLDSFCNYTGLTYGENGWHPFVATLKAYRDGHLSYEKSPLARYYASWQPDNAQEAFIEFTNAPTILAQYPSFAFVSPWHTTSLSERVKHIKDNIKSENRKAGIPDLGVEAGFGLHGPVDAAKGRIEFDRLVRTYESIRKKGYIVESRAELIIGFALVNNEGDYRIIVVHGNHRLAALTVLGYEHVPVRLVAPFVVTKNSSEWWPQVQAGGWSKRQAESYFAHLFDMRQAISQWAKNRSLPPVF